MVDAGVADDDVLQEGVGEVGASIDCAVLRVTKV